MNDCLIKTDCVTWNKIATLWIPIRIFEEEKFKTIKKVVKYLKNNELTKQTTNNNPYWHINWEPCFCNTKYKKPFLSYLGLSKMYTMQNRREKEGIVLFIRAGIQLQSKKGDFEAPVSVASWNLVVLAIQIIKTNI